MPCLTCLACALALMAAPAHAAPDRSRDEERAAEGSEEERAPAPPAKEPEPSSLPPAPAPEKVALPSDLPRASARTKDSPREFPTTRSLALDLGGALVVLGGWAFPKIPLKGSPDDAFHAPGLGAGYQLHLDFTAMDLDWRVGSRGALPGYLGLYGTVGVRTLMGPWANPRLIARGGGGLELMFASAGGATFFVPLLLAEGEASLEFTVVPEVLGLGAALALDVRYGLPLGVGFDLGGYLRANLWF